MYLKYIRYLKTHPLEDLIQRGCVAGGENKYQYLKEGQRRSKETEEERLETEESNQENAGIKDAKGRVSYKKGVFNNVMGC